MNNARREFLVLVVGLLVVWRGATAALADGERDFQRTVASSRTMAIPLVATVNVLDLALSGHGPASGRPPGTSPSSRSSIASQQQFTPAPVVTTNPPSFSPDFSGGSRIIETLDFDGMGEADGS